MIDSIRLGKYKHFKGKIYEAIAVAKHSETLEDYVVYKSCYDNKISQFWIRPLEMFLETVEYKGRKVSRFKFINLK